MAVLDYVNGTLESARRQANRVVTPDSRQKAYDITWSFAQERPILFSFLVAQGLFSFLPLLLFGIFVSGTVALAAISALLFSLFWMGVAALVLGGTLFVTSGLALLAWAWVVGAYLAASFVYGLVLASGRQAGDNNGNNKVEDHQQQQRRLAEKRARIVSGATPSHAAEEEDTGKVSAGEKEGAEESGMPRSW